jgi:hypothetical protein
MFRFDLFGPCPNVDWSNRIGIRARGSSWICQGLDAELIVPSSVGTRRCAVNNISRLSDEEVQAFRGRPFRPVGR